MSTPDLSDLHKTSHSEVESYLTCERRHYYAYGMDLQSRKPSLALSRGLLGHEALAFYYGLHQTQTKKHSDNFKALTMAHIVQQATNYGEVGIALQGELIALMSQYIDYYFDRDCDYEILDIEKEFLVPVGNGFYIKMYVDLILRGWEGIEVWDHKFVYDFYDPKQADLNPQLPKYVGAMELQGIAPNKARYNEIRYRVTKENEQNPEAKFHRQEVKLPRARIERTMAEQIMAAERIQELKSMDRKDWGNRVLRTASEVVCQRCPFKTICALDLNGGDTELEIEFSFKLRETSR